MEIKPASKDWRHGLPKSMGDGAEDGKKHQRPKGVAPICSVPISTMASRTENESMLERLH